MAAPEPDTWLPDNQSTALSIGLHCLHVLLLPALVQKQKGIEEALWGNG